LHGSGPGKAALNVGIKQHVDRAQQRRRRLGIAVATLKKFSEDQSTNLASMVAFWAFFSLFPLLLVGVTVLGYVLPGGTRERVLDHLASYVPLVEPSTLHGLTGSWWPIAVGAVSAIWSGLAVVRTLQNAFNSIWEVPRVDRPGFVEQIWRSLLALSTIGVGLVLVTVISGYVTGQSDGVHVAWYSRAAGYAVAVVVDVGLFVVAFRTLTDRKIDVRDVLPGALLAGVVFWVLQQAASVIVARELSKTQGTYGTFATVITILWWFYLQSQVTLLGAQLNVVLKERLHPRSIFGDPPTEADRRAYEAYAARATYKRDEEVETTFSR
jgi:YihY family inner membrane protein